MDFRIHPLGQASEDAKALFRETGRAEGSLGWYETLAASTLEKDEHAFLALAQDSRGPRAAIVLARSARGGTRALTAPYTTWFGPAACDAEAAQFLGRNLKRAAGGVLRLDALDAHEPFTAALLTGIEHSGFVTARYRHFRNWHQTIDDFDRYWAGRDSRLRETVRRKRKRLEREGRLGFSCLSAPRDIATGMTAYQAVYAASWKPPEPHPNFMPLLAETLSREHTFRLGILTIDGIPAAVQIWLVRAPRATIFKLAHAPQFDQHSPGTVLTHWMLSELCARDQITELDLGRGDDGYKRLWLSEGDFRTGITACKPASFTGLYRIATDILPARAARLLRRSEEEAGA